MCIAIYEPKRQLLVFRILLLLVVVLVVESVTVDFLMIIVVVIALTVLVCGIIMWLLVFRPFSRC